MRFGVLAGSPLGRYVRAEDPESLREDLYKYIRQHQVEYTPDLRWSFPVQFREDVSFLVRTGLERKELAVNQFGYLFVTEN